MPQSTGILLLLQSILAGVDVLLSSQTMGQPVVRQFVQMP